MNITALLTQSLFIKLIFDIISSVLLIEQILECNVVIERSWLYYWILENYKVFAMMNV